MTRRCKDCPDWEARIPVGTHTYTISGTRHVHPVCARLALGGLGTDPALHARLTGAGSADEALRRLEEAPWEALAEQEARELEEALGVKVEAGTTLGDLRARVRAAREAESGRQEEHVAVAN